jgi:hypothetical protein
MGQQPPGAARPQPVQHRIEQLAALTDRGTPTRLGRWDQRFEDAPPSVGEVGAVAAAQRRQSTLLEETRDGEAPQLTAFSDTLWAVVPGPAIGSAFALVQGPSG